MLPSCNAYPLSAAYCIELSTLIKCYCKTVIFVNYVGRLSTQLSEKENH